MLKQQAIQMGTVENNLDAVSYFQTLFITLEIGVSETINPKP